MSATERERDPAADEAPPPEPDPTGDDGGKPAPFSTSELELHQKAIVGLFVLALLGALYLARAVVLPIILAFLFSLLLAPVVRILRHLKSPAGSPPPSWCWVS